MSSTIPLSQLAHSRRLKLTLRFLDEDVGEILKLSLPSLEVRQYLPRRGFLSELSERSHLARSGRDPKRASRNKWRPSDDRRMLSQLTRIEDLRGTVFANDTAELEQVFFSIRRYPGVSRRISLSPAYCHWTTQGRIFRAV